MPCLQTKGKIPPAPCYKTVRITPACSEQENKNLCSGWKVGAVRTKAGGDPEPGEPHEELGLHLGRGRGVRCSAGASGPGASCHPLSFQKSHCCSYVFVIFGIQHTKALSSELLNEKLCQNADFTLLSLSFYSFVHSCVCLQCI